MHRRMLSQPQAVPFLVQLARMLFLFGKNRVNTAYLQVRLGPLCLLLPIHMSLHRGLSTGSKAWLRRHVTDKLVAEARDQGLRSRAYFKFKEIQDKYQLVTPSSLVVDLGAAPGGWSLAVAEIIKASSGGKLCSIDLLPMKGIDNVVIIQGDFYEPVNQQKIMEAFSGSKASVVISDMLHNTTGIREVDNLKSIDLCLAAIGFCEDNLNKGGHFVCKYRSGKDDHELMTSASEMFTSIARMKPSSSRSESTEMYLIARGKKY